MAKIDPFWDYYQHQRQLPDYVLRDLARNVCAEKSYRKNAVEILRNRKSPFVRHEDLKDLLDEIEAELEGIQYEFPAPVEEVKKEPATGAPSASVTTATIFGDGDVIDNGPDKPLSESAVRLVNSIITARVPEENILRDSEDE